MKRNLAIFIFFCSTYLSLACSCGSLEKTDFFSKAKKFDIIVKGTINKYSENSSDTYLIIESVYKGEVEKDTIELRQGILDCSMGFPFETGTQLIIGLLKSSDSSTGISYQAPGCFTSILIVLDFKVKIPENSRFPMIGEPRISSHSSAMSLKKFDKKIRRHI